MSRAAEAWQVAAGVVDPEVPVLTIEDLGVLRTVEVADDDGVRVAITPTYSGCPAVATIQEDVGAALRDAGFARVRVDLVLAPPWTTDWMSEDGKRKLRDFGIAPPTGASRFADAVTTPDRPVRRRGPGGSGAGGAIPGRRGPVPVTISVRCPLCGSGDTQELSRFGSTACKALYRCRACGEPFDHFKVH